MKKKNKNDKKHSNPGDILRIFSIKAIRFIVPEGVPLLIFLVAYSFFQPQLVYFKRYIMLFMTATMIVSFFAAWRFHRSRFAYLTVLFWLIYLYASNQILYMPSTEMIHPQILIDILIPVNLILFAGSMDRGLFHLKSGGFFIFFLVVQGFILSRLISEHTVVFQGVFINHVHSWERLAGLCGWVALVLFLIWKTWRRFDRSLVLVWWMIILFLPQLFFKLPDLYGNYRFLLAELIIALTLLEISFRLAYFDELTGLPARRALNEILRDVSGTYSIAMIDIDHFKKFNDRFGHDVGDQVLKMVASQLSKGIGGGKAYRYGGEEFAIIFPGKSKKDVLDTLERLRQRICTKVFVVRKKRRPVKRGGSSGTVPSGKSSRKQRKTKVSVSIGVSESIQGLSPNDVIKAADKALYKAKRNGRNRIETG